MDNSMRATYEIAISRGKTGLDYSYEIFLPARNIPRAPDELTKPVPAARRP